MVRASNMAGARAEGQSRRVLAPGVAMVPSFAGVAGRGTATAFLDQPAEPRLMSHRSIHSANLPKPVGPYSPGVGFERLVFVSGQGATDPVTGRLAGTDTATQTEQCLKNVRTILQAAGSDLQYVLRCGVFLLDMKEFDQMNGVYARAFGDHRPARTTIQAAGLPGSGLRVEIDCIAYTP